VRVFSKHFCVMFQGPRNYYLEFPASKTMSPLIPIENDVAERLLSLDPPAADHAFGLVKHIDEQTVCVTPMVKYLRGLPWTPPAP
jgi:hypothetical protein